VYAPTLLAVPQGNSQNLSLLQKLLHLRFVLLFADFEQPTRVSKKQLSQIQQKSATLHSASSVEGEPEGQVLCAGANLPVFVHFGRDQIVLQQKLPQVQEGEYQLCALQEGN
jgi:hypothetical protein